MRVAAAGSLRAGNLAPDGEPGQWTPQGKGRKEYRKQELIVEELRELAWRVGDEAIPEQHPP